MRPVYIRLYAGWLSNRDGSPSFRTFANFSTHQQLIEPTQYKTVPLPTFSPAVAATATMQFWKDLEIIKAPFCRYVLARFWHTAAVYSLLDSKTSNFPSALCCFTTAPDMLLFLKTLFSWYGDRALSTQLSPHAFSAGLLERKDQPLVVEDAGDLTHNGQLLLNTIAIHEVSWKIGKEPRPFPIQTPILILSDRTSALTCDPRVATLDLPPNCLDSGKWVERFRHMQSNYDYLAAFNSFVQANYSEFRDLLVSAYQEALRRSKDQLNETSTKSFGSFLAVSVLLTKFFSACSLTYDDLPVDLLDEVLQQQLFEFFEQCSFKSDSVNLADQFVMVVRDAIHHRTLCLRPQTSAYDPSISNIVYADADTIFFPKDIFFNSCHSMAQSRPQVLRSLENRNMLCGSRINRDARQTRITVYDLEGKSVQLRGYAVSRSSFDLLGDPLLIEEVDF